MNYNYSTNFIELSYNYNMDFIEKSSNFLFKANNKNTRAVVKYIHSQQQRYQNNVNIVLVTLLLTLNVLFK